MGIEELTDLRTPWCVHVAVTLRIAEHIRDGVTSLAGLAEAAKCDERALGLVLRQLVGRGVFIESAPGEFALNDLALELLHPGAQLGLNLDGIGGRMAHAWATLPTFVRTGKPGYTEVCGRPFWDDLEAHPEVAASFDELIGPGGHGDFNGAFEISGGWDAIRTVVDVGGGTGSMLAAILKARPHVTGILVDLPRTVARSGEIFRAAEVEGRATTVGQSFFDPLPAGADLYLLRGVLNDWPDAEAGVILKRCAEAAGPAGRIVILKGIRENGTPENLEIEVILCGGKQRTLKEFIKLAGANGMQVISSGRQNFSFFTVECVSE